MSQKLPSIRLEDQKEEDLLLLISELHKKLIKRGNTKDWEDKIKNNKKCKDEGIASISYYNRLRVSSKNRKASINKNIKEKAVAILGLFQEEFKLSFSLKNGTLSYQIAGNINLSNENDYYRYLVYYWRADEDQAKEKVVVAQLSIDTNWGMATLTMKYRRQSQRVLKGKIDIMGHYAYFNLQDNISDSMGGFQPVRFMMICYFAGKSSLTNRDMWCTFMTVRKRNEGSPNVGIGFIEYIDKKESWEKRFNEQIVGDDIQYLLYRKRYFVPNLHQISVEDKESIQAFQKYVGVYQCKVFYLSNEKDNENLTYFALNIQKNGRVEIISENVKNGYYGQCRILNSYEVTGKVVLVIDVDYVPKKNHYRLRFILNGDFDKDNNLYGIRSGIRKEGMPMSGRMFLKKLYDSKSIEGIKFEDFIVEKNIITKSEHLFENGLVIKNIEEHFKENSFKDFIFAMGEKERYTDAYLIHKFKKTGLLNKNSTLLKRFSGNYDLLYFTLKINDFPEEIGMSNAVIEKYPIYFKEDGNFSIRINEIYNGQLSYDEGLLGLNSIDSFPLCGFFSVPTKWEDTRDFYFGVIAGVQKDRPEGRVCVLIKDNSNDKKNEELFLSKINEEIEINNEGFHEADEKFGGALSFLRGPINRIVRSPKSASEFRPRSNDSFKKSFFYAACYLAQKGNFEESYKNLRQAYSHGFGQNRFAGSSISNFKSEISKVQGAIDELQNERNLLITELKNNTFEGMNEIQKREIIDLWEVKDIEIT